MSFFIFSDISVKEELRKFWVFIFSEIKLMVWVSLQLCWW